MDAKGVLYRLKEQAGSAVRRAADAVSRARAQAESEPHLELELELEAEIKDDAELLDDDTAELRCDDVPELHDHDTSELASYDQGDVPASREGTAPLGWIDVRLAALEDADAVICGAPFEVQDGRGAATAPADIRAASDGGAFSSRTDMKLIDLGDIVCSSRGELFEILEDTAMKLSSWGRPFAFVGGDASIAIPILRGMDRAKRRRLGVLRLGASPALLASHDGDALSPRCVASRAYELRSVADSGCVVFVGARDVSAEEERTIAERGALVLGPGKIRRKGARDAVKRICKRLKGCDDVYVSIDIGVLDPAFAPGASYQSFGGMDPVELVEILRGVMSRLPIVGFDLTGAAPRRDLSGVTTSAAIGILSACWSALPKK